MSEKKHEGPAAGWSRRDVLRSGGVMASAALLGSVAGRSALAAEKVVRIGYVSPQTGPLAPFAAADAFILDSVRKVLGDALTIAGQRYRLEILVKDSQSNPNRAAEVASELILSDKVDLMLVSSTPETTNPVSDQCELNQVPCLSTVAPWQPWFFTRGGDPQEGFEWTYHFFWGVEDVIDNYTGMWAALKLDKPVVGGLFPNDGDGNAWGDAERGFPPVLRQKGFTLVDPGRFQSLTDDFSAQIAAFKKADAQIATGVVIPPDLTTFWTQARQQGFRPQAVSMGKALLFPSAVEALGKAGHNLSTEIWWSPSHPFSSSLTGAGSAQLARQYSEATGKQWTQPLGFVHALFELAVDILRRSQELSPEAIRDALLKTQLQTVVGPIQWQGGPVRNVAKTPLVSGQWRLGGDFVYDLVITHNGTAPKVPLGGDMQPITY